MDPLDAWIQRFEQQSLAAMKRIAFDGEWVTRDNRGWQDDSHSAEISITGFVVDHDDPHRQFTDPAWKMAQKPGYVSPRHKNPHTNFFPVSDNSVQVPDEDLTVIVTGWTHYLPRLEFDTLLGSFTFTRSLDEMRDVADFHLTNFLKAV